MGEYNFTPLSSLDELKPNFAIPLTQFGTISVSGEQQNDYLHSQLTIDFKNFPKDKSRLCAHCDSKGKTWSVMSVCKFGAETWMSTAMSALDSSLSELKKYGVFSKVTITDESQNLVQFAGHGEVIEEFIVQQFKCLPDEHMQTVENAIGVVSRLEFQPSLYQLTLKHDGALAFRQYLNSHSIPTYAPEVFEAIAVKNGIPQVSETNIGQFVPQMMNVQALDAIDFKKGCYMGQEVIARTHYLGKNKRAAMIFKLNGSCEITPGDKLELQLGDNWRSGGVVLRSGSLQNETWLLAVVANDTSESSVFRLQDKPSSEFSPLPLPYSIADDSNVLKKK